MSARGLMFFLSGALLTSSLSFVGSVLSDEAEPENRRPASVEMETPPEFATDLIPQSSAGPLRRAVTAMSRSARFLASLRAAQAQLIEEATGNSGQASGPIALADASDALLPLARGSRMGQAYRLPEDVEDDSMKPSTEPKKTPRALLPPIQTGSDIEAFMRTPAGN